MPEADVQSFAQEELPLILTIRFTPNNLPTGAIFAQDLARFLDGMQLAFNGLLEYDHDELFEDPEQSRFIIIAFRPGSLECDIVLNFFLSLPDLPHFALLLGGGVAGWLAQNAASAYINDLLAGSGKATREKIGRRLKKFMDTLRHVTSPDALPDTQQLSAGLTQKIQPGVKQMAEVGGKPEYQPNGITISANVESQKTAVFNAETEARIDKLLERAIESYKLLARTEVATVRPLALETPQPTSVSGVIEEVDRKKHSFRLKPAGGAKSPRHQCYYSETEDANICELLLKGTQIYVRGLRHSKGRSKRSSIIKVLEIVPLPPFEEIAHQNPKRGEA